jgi:hypothetical protein
LKIPCESPASEQSDASKPQRRFATNSSGSITQQACSLSERNAKKITGSV